MKIFANPERRGIAGLALIVLIILGIMAVMNGGLEKWLNITWFSGPSIEGRVVYLSERSGTAELYVQDLDSSDAVKITSGAAAQGMPAISPNLRKILFGAYYSKLNNIFSIRADGKGLKQISRATGPKSRPGFSADGNSIYFVASGKLYAADSEGGSPGFILPTRREQSAAIHDGEEMPIYKDYAFEDKGEGVLASCETSLDVDQLAYLESEGKDVARIPLSGDASERVSVAGICAVPGKKAFVVAANLGKNAMMMYIDPSSAESRMLLKVANAQIGKPAVAASGDSVVVPAIDMSNNKSYALLQFPIAGGQPVVLSNSRMENPLYLDNDKKILATQYEASGEGRNIVLLDLDKRDMKQLTSDGKSYNPAYRDKNSQQ